MIVCGELNSISNNKWVIGEVSDRWSGRGGYAREWGLRFESHQPRSTRFYAKKCAICDFDGDGRANNQWAFPEIKCFFPIFKNRFHIFWKNKIHFHRRFSVTRLWKLLIFRHPAQTVLQTACEKGLGTACIVLLCTSERKIEKVELREIQ